MTTIWVSLDDETFARLKAAAEAEGVPVESLASRALQTQYKPSEVSDEVRGIIERQIEAYRPVYRRLAQ